MSKYTPWIVSATAQKQSNYGCYKAGLHRGEGKTFESVRITADNPELALEIARNAAAAPELLGVCEMLLGMARITDKIDELDLINARSVIAKAKGGKND